MLAHELTHIRNDDVRMMVIAVVIAGILSFVGEMSSACSIGRAGRAARRGSGSRSKGGGAIAASLIAVALIAVWPGSCRW